MGHGARDAGSGVAEGWREGEFAREAAARARVADVAVALPYDAKDHRVVVAVGEHLAHRQPVARRLAFQPQRLAAAAVEGGESRVQGSLKGFVVHEAQHQYFTRFVVLRDGGYQAVQFREIHRVILSHGAWGIHRRPSGYGGQVGHGAWAPSAYCLLPTDYSWIPRGYRGATRRAEAPVLIRYQLVQRKSRMARLDGVGCVEESC